MPKIYHGFKVSFNSWRLPQSLANEQWEQKRCECPVRIWNDPACGAARSVKKVPLNEALCDEAVFFGLLERTVPVI